MSLARVAGLILVGLGAILLIIGVTESRSVANSLSSTFLGHMTRATMWYVFGGIASAVVGLILALGVPGRART